MIDRTSVHFFADSADGALSLAEALGAPFRPVSVHTFPDGESLVTAADPAPLAVVYRPLHQPNVKLIDLILAASALRDGGAQHVLLVAPYLAYMRQDAAFAAGQAISQKVIGSLLGGWFDGFVAVAPHLHRVHALTEVFPGHPAVAVAPVDILAALIRAEPDPNIILIGPDEESEPLVQAVARAVGARFGIGSKSRHGDTEVELALPSTTSVRGRRVILVDDMISTGHTIVAAARAAFMAGASSVEAIVCHALHKPLVDTQLAAAGILRVRSCDGVPHSTNAAALGPGLARAVRDIACELEGHDCLSEERRVA